MPQTVSDRSGYDRLIQKLDTIGTLDEADRQALTKLPLNVRHAAARQELVHEGDRPDHCLLLIDGFMQRYKMLRDGTRQIMSFHIPGDIPDLLSLHLPRMDHALGTLTPCTLAAIPHQALLELTRAHPNVAAAMWRDTLMDAAVFREWIVNLGARPGVQRIAHMLCEFFERLKAVGLIQNDSYPLPLTQTEIGEATGLSTVHVNRMMQELRSLRLIETKGKVLIILDWKRLQNFASFDPSYLHVKKMDQA